MSGHFFGNEIKLTKRYKLGLTIGAHCRNFLLMTATPHNGKEEDFQIFLALLDGESNKGVVWTADISYWIAGQKARGAGEAAWETEEGYLERRGRGNYQPNIPFTLITLMNKVSDLEKRVAALERGVQP